MMPTRADLPNDRPQPLVIYEYTPSSVLRRGQKLLL